MNTCKVTMSVSKISTISCKKAELWKEIDDSNGMKTTVSNQHEDVSYWNLLYVPVILFACTVATFPQAMIPRHNSIIHPAYWFENNLVFGFALLTLTTVYVLECFILTEEKTLISFWVFLRLFIWNMIGWLVPYCLAFYLWSIHLGYRHPMPLVGVIWLFNGWVWIGVS